MRVAANYAAVCDPSQYEAVDVAVSLVDVDSGREVEPHRGSVTYNRWRNRFVVVFTEKGGTSPLGEVWYSEAVSLKGPWNKAIKIVTHSKMSFYNPQQHPEFEQQNGRMIYFEGTYTHTFSGNPHPVPRYEYNQLMYRLDLADTRIAEHFPESE